MYVVPETKLHDTKFSHNHFKRFGPFEGYKVVPDFLADTVRMPIRNIWHLIFKLIDNLAELCNRSVFPNATQQCLFQYEKRSIPEPLILNS
jgi:hypothetical protein